MDKSECKNILALIQTAYPRFYVNSTRQDLINAINLWHEMFGKDKFDDVIDAIKSLIAENLFPPTISEVKQKIVDREMDKKYELFTAWQLEEDD